MKYQHRFSYVFAIFMLLTGITVKVAVGQDLFQEHFVGHTNYVTSAVFSPDGKYVLTGSFDKTARLWDANTGKELQQFLGHTNYVTSAVFSPDGKYVLTGSFDKTAR